MEMTKLQLLHASIIEDKEGLIAMAILSPALAFLCVFFPDPKNGILLGMMAIGIFSRVLVWAMILAGAIKPSQEAIDAVLAKHRDGQKIKAKLTIGDNFK